MKKDFWQKKQKMIDEVLVTFKGKPLITADMLEKEIQQILKTDKIYAETYKVMGRKCWSRDMLEHMIKRRIVHEYMLENNIRDQPKLFYFEVFNEIKSLDISDVVFKREQQYKIFHEKFQELRKKYEVVVNEDYFLSGE